MQTMSATSWLVCLATFICAVVEDIKGLHCSRAPLFIAEDQIDPFMQMGRHILWFLNTDKYHLHQQNAHTIRFQTCISLRIDLRPESARRRLGKTCVVLVLKPFTKPFLTASGFNRTEVAKELRRRTDTDTKSGPYSITHRSLEALYWG